MSRKSRTFTLLGVLAVVATAGALQVFFEDSWYGLLAVPAALVVASAMLGLEEVSWRELGLRRPRRWWKTWLLAAALAAGTLLVVGAWIGPFVTRHLGEPDLSEFDAIRGSPGRLALWLAAAWTLAAFGEELLLRGFLLSRLTFVFGGTDLARAGAVVGTAALQGVAHAYQGPAGMVLTGVVGLLFCIAFLATGRNLWVVVLAHGLFDTVGFVALYSR